MIKYSLPITFELFIGIYVSLYIIKADIHIYFYHRSLQIVAVHIYIYTYIHHTNDGAHTHTHTHTHTYTSLCIHNEYQTHRCAQLTVTT